MFNKTKKSPMVLNDLKIERKRYGENAGKFEGRASFDSENANVTIKITPEMCQKILDLCADALVETANEMADVMRCDIIEGMSVERKAIT
jgi:hypothetical protein